MLILKRRFNEDVVIGDLVVVRIVGFDHSGVRLGITAPRDIEVHRREVWERSNPGRSPGPDFGAEP